MLELIAEKQKQLELLIKVEEFAAAEVGEYANGEMSASADLKEFLGDTKDASAAAKGLDMNDF